MKIASWNVNSLRVRLEHVLKWLETESPDILALQETKMTDDQFPRQEIEDAGYHVVYSGQKTYNGVALLSKTEPKDVLFDLPGLDEPQRRIAAARYGDLLVLNLYVVNGSSVGSDKYAHKMGWLEKVTAWIEEYVGSHQKFIILGDFNIAPTDRDVHNPKSWHEKILCSTPEREALKSITDLGFHDSFRLFEQDDETWSWWDYRSGGLENNKGLRIDLILSSTLLAEQCVASYIDSIPRNWERPSDHAPAVAEFRSVL